MIRLQPEVMERVKKQTTEASIPMLPKEIEEDTLVKSISGAIPVPTHQMLEQDDRLTLEPGNG